MVINSMYTCKTCKVAKRAEDFYVDNSMHSGRASECIECKLARGKRKREAERAAALPERIRCKQERETLRAEARNSITHKICCDCGQEKPVTAFQKSATCFDGYRGQCKNCRNETSRLALSIMRDDNDYLDMKRRSFEKYRSQHPAKHKAHQELLKAMRKGEIVKGPCEKCGSSVNVEGHHDDYDKPLQVQWLCFECHRREHGQLQ